MRFPVPATPPSEAAMALRPVGYALWGVLFFLFTFAVLALPVIAAFAIRTGPEASEPAPDLTIGSIVGLLALLVIAVPLFAFLCILLPWTLFSQAMLGFVFAAQSASGSNDHTRIAAIAAAAQAAWLEPRVDSPGTRFWSAIGRVPEPDKALYISAMAVVLGGMIVVFSSELIVTVAGTVVLLAGIAFHLPAVVRRLRAELAARSTTPIPAHQ